MNRWKKTSCSPFIPVVRRLPSYHWWLRPMATAWREQQQAAFQPKHKPSSTSIYSSIQSNPSVEIHFHAMFQDSRRYEEVAVHCFSCLPVGLCNSDSSMCEHVSLSLQYWSTSSITVTSISFLTTGIQSASLFSSSKKATRHCKVSKENTWFTLPSQTKNSVTLYYTWKLPVTWPARGPLRGSVFKSKSRVPTGGPYLVRRAKTFWNHEWLELLPCGCQIVSV